VLEPEPTAVGAEEAVGDVAQEDVAGVPRADGLPQDGVQTPLAVSPWTTRWPLCPDGAGWARPRGTGRRWRCGGGRRWCCHGGSAAPATPRAPTCGGASVGTHPPRPRRRGSTHRAPRSAAARTPAPGTAAACHAPVQQRRRLSGGERRLLYYLLAAVRQSKFVGRLRLGNRARDAEAGARNFKAVGSVGVKFSQRNFTSLRVKFLSFPECMKRKVRTTTTSTIQIVEAHDAFSNFEVFFSKNAGELRLIILRSNFEVVKHLCQFKHCNKATNLLPKTEGLLSFLNLSQQRKYSHSSSHSNRSNNMFGFLKI
jgi:hypothetical protein